MHNLLSPNQSTTHNQTCQIRPDNGIRKIANEMKTAEREASAQPLQMNKRKKKERKKIHFAENKLSRNERKQTHTFRRVRRMPAKKKCDRSQSN